MKYLVIILLFAGCTKQKISFDEPIHYKPTNYYEGSSRFVCGGLNAYMDFSSASSPFGCGVGPGYTAKELYGEGETCQCKRCKEIGNYPISDWIRNLIEPENTSSYYVDPTSGNRIVINKPDTSSGIYESDHTGTFDPYIHFYRFDDKIPEPVKYKDLEPNSTYEEQ